MEEKQARKREQISITLSPALAKEIRDAAEANDRPITQEGRELLKLGLRARRAAAQAKESTTPASGNG